MSDELTMPEFRSKYPDIWETASGIATAPKAVGALFSENYVMPLARAILAERDRKLNVAAAATAFCEALEDDGTDFHIEVGPQGGWLLDSTEMLPLSNALERALIASAIRGGPRYISDDLKEAADALRVLRTDERIGYLLSAAAEELDRLKLAVESPPTAPRGFKWQLIPDYPIGEVIGPCVCGSWPGGKCLKCPVQSHD